ncbi:MAG: complex I subunit 5 family protein [Bryobacteraceae bacterium]
MPFAPVLPVAIPLFTAALLAALTKAISSRVSLLISIAGTFATTGASALLIAKSLDRTIVYWFGGWSAHNGKTLGISFAIDPIGAGLAAFAGLLTFAALVFSAKYFDTAANHFHALILAFLAGMSGFTLTGDMFNLFVFFELMSAAAFALCGHKTEDASSLQGTINFAVTNTIGAYFVLTGIALLYARASALNMAQMGRTLAQHAPDALVLAAFAFISCGYLIKAAVVPFHFWLADAHAVAPTPVCVLFSGVMVEMGLYAVARIYWAVFEPALHPYERGLRMLLVGIGAATAIVGAIMCYSQRNLKRLLAFSTISHMGLMTAGVGLLTVGGLAGASIYALGHGLVKAGLFLAAGIVLHRLESVDEIELHGRGRRLKWAALVFFLGALGLAGIPPSGLSLGDNLMHASAENAGYSWIKWVSLFAASATAAAVLRSGARVFLGWGPREESEHELAPKAKEKPETETAHHVTPPGMPISAMACVLAGLFLAFVPRLKDGTMAAASRFEDSAGYAARVLEGSTVAVHGAPTEVAAPIWGAIALGIALSVASGHLFSERFRKFAERATVPMKPLHALHSGHIGDYVTFLTFGIAVFGLVCIFSFH